MKSHYDFYEYRVPTKDDYCTVSEDLGILIILKQPCFLKVHFLSDGSRCTFFCGLTHPKTPQTYDFNAKKFISTMTRIQSVYSKSKSKTVPLITKREVL